MMTGMMVENVTLALEQEVRGRFLGHGDRATLGHGAKAAQTMGSSISRISAKRNWPSALSVLISA